MDGNAAEAFRDKNMAERMSLSLHKAHVAELPIAKEEKDVRKDKIAMLGTS